MATRLFLLLGMVAMPSIGFLQPESLPPTETQGLSAEHAPEESEASRWAEQRREVIDAVGRTLERRAFTVGVDFSSWTTKASDAADRLDAAQTPGELTTEINRVLGSFGISHVKLKGPSEPSDRNKPPGSRQPETKPPVPTTRENQTLTWEPGDVAVLKVRSFDDDQYSRLKVEGFIDEIRPRARGVVIDLRANGGGAVSAMTHLLGLFLKKDTALGVYVNREIVGAYERSKGVAPASATDAAAWTERKFRVRRNARDPLALPLAVLLSRGSASASEIIAAALRDHSNAVLLGQPSAGKVLLSVHAKLPHGFELQFPTADYVTSKGVRLEGAPIRPHVALPSGRGTRPQAAVDAAVEVLLHGM